MPFGIIILLRVLFGICMVFIIGYVFGSFSQRPALVTLTKIAAILAIVLFVSTNVLAFRFGAWRHGNRARYHCSYVQHDSSGVVQPDKR